MRKWKGSRPDPQRAALVDTLEQGSRVWELWRWLDTGQYKLVCLPWRGGKANYFLKSGASRDGKMLEAHEPEVAKWCASKIQMDALLGVSNAASEPEAKPSAIVNPRTEPKREPRPLERELSEVFRRMHRELGDKASPTVRAVLDAFGASSVADIEDQDLPVAIKLARGRLDESVSLGSLIGA